MSLHHCKVVEFVSGTVKAARVLRLLDSNNQGIQIETFVQKPYRSMLKVLGEIVAFETHSDIRTALTFHRSVATDIHAMAVTQSN
jgi:hypothetical protein